MARGGAKFGRNLAGRGPLRHDRGDGHCTPECGASERVHQDDGADEQTCPVCGGSGYACWFGCVYDGKGWA